MSAVPAMPAPSDLFAPQESPEQRIELPSLPEPQVPTPQHAPEDASKAKFRRTLLTLAVNLVIALLLVGALVVVASAVVNEGNIDASTFTMAKMKTLFVAEGDYSAIDISNGLYETKTGRPVFYVRGDVSSRATAGARVRVKVELLAEDVVVRSGETWATAAPTPEELYQLDAPDALDALLSRQAKRAKPVTPDERAPFVMPFYEYPPDLKAFRVRVSVRAEDAATAAR